MRSAEQSNTYKMLKTPKFCLENIDWKQSCLILLYKVFPSIIKFTHHVASNMNPEKLNTWLYHLKHPKNSTPKVNMETILVVLV